MHLRPNTYPPICLCLPPLRTLNTPLSTPAVGGWVGAFLPAVSSGGLAEMGGAVEGMMVVVVVVVGLLLRK